MPISATHRSALTAAVLALTFASASFAEAPKFCPVLMDEERLEWADRRIDVEVAEATLAAYERILKMTTQLREIDAIDELTYLEAKYDFDAAVIAVRRAKVKLSRQDALLTVYGETCGEDVSPEEARRASRAHLEANCEQQDLLMQQEKINLTYQIALLESVKELHGTVATDRDVILAELAVEQEELRRADAERRVAECRRRLFSRSTLCRRPSSPNRRKCDCPGGQDLRPASQ